jgi:hypothetical protein
LPAIPPFTRQERHMITAVLLIGLIVARLALEHLAREHGYIR